MPVGPGRSALRSGNGWLLLSQPIRVHGKFQSSLLELSARMTGESWVVGPTILEAEKRESVTDKSPKRQDVVKDSLKERKTLIPALCYAV